VKIIYSYFFFKNNLIIDTIANISKLMPTIRKRLAKCQCIIFNEIPRIVNNNPIANKIIGFLNSFFIIIKF